MPYDDEQTKEFEKNFKQWTEKLKELTPEKIKELDAAINTLAKAALKLKSIPERNAEEEKLFQKIKEITREVYQRLSDTMLVLGEKNFRNANIIYRHIKQKAAEGDEQAIKALKDLEPSYKAMLKEQHPEN